jgi:hypothetical protein
VTPKTPPIDSENLVVKAISAHRITSSGFEFKVEFKHPDVDAVWKRAAELSGCGQALSQYAEQNGLQLESEAAVEPTVSTSAEGGGLLAL